MPTLDQLRQAAHDARIAVDSNASRATIDQLYAAHGNYTTALGNELARLTASNTLDVPPGYEVSELDTFQTWHVCAGGDSWDDEFSSTDRESARVECWQRFTRGETAWAEFLAALLASDRVGTAVDVG